MWEVPNHVAASEIGQEQVSRLEALRRWLYPGEQTELVFRVAPSLVARCEVELFDISMPRFALRAYLTSKSFINARRIQMFCEMATYWGSPPDDEYERLDLAGIKQPPGESDRIRMRRSSCIGDSLLEQPSSLPRSEYHLLTVELGLAYGEHERIEGTPFVTHIRLGGGLCAQAVCFLATALHQSTARGIYGVGEITALASDEDARTINLEGMTPDRICAYFNHPKVGLSAWRETIPYSEPGIWKFTEALRSYALSDVPVILCLDLGRMCGVKYVRRDGQKVAESEHTYLFADNGLSQELMKQIETSHNDCIQPGKIKMRHHTVLLVGARRDRDVLDVTSAEFVLHDPSTYPFLKATARRLADVRVYDERKWMPQQTGNADEDMLGPIQFIPVAPREVRLPLTYATSHGRTFLGLVDIAVSICEDRSLPQLPTFAWPLDPQGGIRLVDLRWCESPQRVDIRFARRLAEVPSAGNDDMDASRKDVRGKLEQLVKQGEIPARWCWIQYGPAEQADGKQLNAAWVWDATVPPPPEPKLPVHELREKYLLALLVAADDGWQLIYTCPEHRRLRPAVISSFRTREVTEVRSRWPDDPLPGVDLYVFMQAEVNQWLAAHEQPGGPPNGPNYAVKAMAELADDQGAIDEWAGRVCESFPPKELPVVAVTSFVPEVTSPQREAYERACCAVRFLLGMATALKREGHKDLRTVELVAGSRIAGVWPARGERYVATRLHADVARRRVLSILGRVMSPYEKTPREGRISVALELEPGPMYSLRDWQSLVDLCEEIDKDPLLSQFVGVNLDIAHWRLARDITPEQVWDTPVVRDRIVHAHIAGHHRCSHLGDLPLGDLNQPEDFRPWIDLLNRIATDWRDPMLPQFSGYVSLEMEAAKSRDLVTDSTKKLASLLRTGRW